MQLFLSQPQVIALPQLGRITILAMDWTPLRKGLQGLRIERKMDVPELAAEAGVAKTTIYRLENLNDPHGIDLETVDKVVRAMGLTLADFFARIEDSREMPMTGVHVQPPAVSSETADRAAVSPAAIAVVLAEHILQIIDDAFDNSARAARGQTAAPRRDAPVRNGDHRDAGRSRPPRTRKKRPA